MKAGRFINGWTITALLLVIAIIAGSVVIAQKCSHSNQAIEITLAPEREITGTIYVGGAVNNPGYYPIFAGDTLEDIVGAAGGLKEGASLDNVELTIGEPDSGKTQKIDINRAEVWLLEALPGVGATKAQAIIDYRKEHGFFRDINELMNVPGFGDVSFDNIKDLITVND
ncbi:MAG: ComEA family DNA-binding protein [Dehalococcoidales bacterium]